MRLFKTYILEHWKYLIVPILGMLITLYIETLLPLLQQIFIDDILFKADTSLVIKFAIVFMVITIIRCIFGYIKEFAFDKLAVDVVRSIRRDLFVKISSMPFSFYDKNNTGELMSRIDEDANMVWETLGYALRLSIEMIILFILSMYMMSTMNVTLTAICLGILIPVAIMGFIFEKKFSNVYLNISDQKAKINDVAQQNIAGIRLVKAFAREKHEISKFLGTNQQLYDLNLNQARLMSKFVPTIDFLCDLSNVALIVIGGILCINGQVTLGMLVAFSQYLLILSWCVKYIGTFITILAQTKASLNRIYKILDEENDITSPVDGYKPDIVIGAIEFRNVSFKYNEQIVLENINLVIPAGSSLAIMGATGCGKSTLLSLIGRYYDVFEGEVLVDGVNVKEWDLHTLRSNLNVVFQESFLFSDSIKNNIDFGCKHSIKETEEAARISTASKFISELENGYDTEIGERGIGLSGGQKQRLTISRALINKSSMLILDDATSALDMETEYNVLQNLANAENKSTTLIVAHRISGVKDADLIIYLENGKIVESGNHQSLLDKKGYYYNIYIDQFKEFIPLEEVC
ncbi:ABC transporter [Candidatus Epulonipiscioides gigas]|nr:ABC transporter [Epulopiscium sp. SCG-C07WGA-EpuloA2]